MHLKVPLFWSFQDCAGADTIWILRKGFGLVCETHLCVEALTFAGIDAFKTGCTRLGLVVLQSLGAGLCQN